MSEPLTRLLLCGDPTVGEEGLSHQLRNRGFAVLTSDGGPEAMRTIGAKSVDLVVVEVNGQGRSSKWRRRLLERAARSELPFIPIAVGSTADPRDQALGHGAAIYLATSADVDLLAAQLRSLRQRQLARPQIGAPEAGDSPPYSTTELQLLGSGSLSASAPQLAMVDAGAGTSASDCGELELPPAFGSLLGGRYRFEGLIDRGGFGSVYKGVDLHAQQPVAIKVLHPHLVASAKIVRRFQLEAISTCRVRHPNAVAVLDTGTTPSGIPYLVMEYLEGLTLDAELRHKGVLPFSRCTAIINQLCNVLTHAHSHGLIHRDIKPANIHLSWVGDGERVKVLDFGLAKLLGDEQEGYVSSGETIIGTPQFMAPERLVGRAADARADVYSVGVTLFLMLTGSLPFGESDENLLARAIVQLRAQPVFIQRLRPELPDALALFLMRMVARSRRERPTLSEVTQQLNAWSERWQEPWPPQLASNLRSPLELGQTRKLSGEPKPHPGDDEWSLLPTPPQGVRTVRDSHPKRRG